GWVPRVIGPLTLVAALLITACGGGADTAGDQPTPEKPQAASGAESESLPASQREAEVPSNPAPELAGEWRVTYWDEELGGVQGQATIDTAGASATVELGHPRTGERFTLRSRSLSRNGATVRLELEGPSPRSQQLDGLHFPQEHLVVPVAARQLTFSHGEDELGVELAERPKTDSETIYLEFELSDGALVGTWRYRGHAFLERDDDGYGRAGYVERDDDGTAWVVGSEGWTRPQPAIFGVVSIEDQLGRMSFSDATSSPNYPYPFTGQHTGKTTRNLFVFGRDLPLDLTRRVDIQSSDPSVSYVMLARPGDAARSPFHRQNFDRGWEKLLAGLPASAHAAARELDAVIVRATFEEGALPGFHELRFEGTRGSWLLQFGDNTAAVSFVREVRSPRHAEDRAVYERIGDAFSPEVVAIEVETEVALPTDTLRVIVGRNGERLELGGDDGLVAGRVGPRRYRTSPLLLSDSGGEITVKPGDRLFAKLGQPGLISVEPNIAQLSIHRTPAAPGIETLWADAVVQAAECQNLEAPPTAEIEGQSSKSIDTFLFNSGQYRVPIPGWLRAPVQVGHHAAMLLLRQTFLQLMQAYDEELAGLQTDDQIRAYRRYIEPSLWRDATGISRIEVDGPDGISRHFAATFDVHGVAESYHLTLPQADRWVLDATRQAIARYRQAVATSLAGAEGIGACEVVDLLQLTGADFEAVVEVTRSRLMRLTEVGATPQLRWQPNYRARAWLDNVGLLADTVELHQQLASQDRTELTLALSVAAAPVGILGELVGLEAMVVGAFLIDVLDLAMNGVEIGSEIVSRGAEVDFALGAADVLGIARLQRAEAQERGWGFAVGSLIASGAPMMVFDLDAVGKLAWIQPFALPKWAEPWLTGLKYRDAMRGRSLARNLAGERVPSGEGAVRGSAEPSGRVPDDGATEPSPTQPPSAEPPSAEPPSAEPPSPQTAALWNRFMREASDGDRRALFAWLEQANAARQAGRALTDLQRRTLELLESWPPVRWRLGLERPEGLSEASWQEVRRFIFRGDVVDLLQNGGASALDQALSSGGRRGEIAREVLEYTPQRTPEQYLREIEARLKVRDSPGVEYFDQTGSDPTLEQQLEALGWFFELTGPAADGLMDLRVVDPNKNFAAVKRGYFESEATFVLSSAFRRQVLPYISGGLPVPLNDKGVPTIQYMTLRLMKDLGIGYAGSGKPLEKVKISTNANFRTCFELEWMRKTYRPESTIEELVAEGAEGRFLMQTHSVRYAKSLLAMAGYRVTGARMAIEDMLRDGMQVRSSLSSLSGLYSPTRYGGVPESKAEFLERFGMSEQAEGANFFDIELTVEPLVAGGGA
ncbi:MAG: hypothetical protein AAF560_15085, partial [Acidobacteriota bacterium]